jgi:hypothetical protein
MAVLQDLARAHIQSCDAVFVLCNKAPADAEQEDLQTQMACLAIGQYIQVCTACQAPACCSHSLIRCMHSISITSNGVHNSTCCTTALSHF